MGAKRHSVYWGTRLLRWQATRHRLSSECSCRGRKADVGRGGVLPRSYTSCTADGHKGALYHQVVYVSFLCWLTCLPVSSDWNSVIVIFFFSSSRLTIERAGLCRDKWDLEAMAFCNRQLMLLMLLSNGMITTTNLNCHLGIICVCVCVESL